MTEMKVINEDRLSQFFVLSDGINYELKWDDSRLTTHIKEINKEDYSAYLSGERTGEELMHKASYGVWPAIQEAQDKVKKERAEKRPIVLISNPKNQKLFSQEELEKLIPLAEKAWIDWKGKLPDNYVSPIN
ncbi:hypothetical protein [Lactococcus sp.]|uniref:hypothetical protein n=1 Tax=Lactococcus sp. TaxID=44273 RepID=UPI002FC80C28